MKIPILFLLLLSGCASQRTFIVHPLESSGFESFTIAPVQIKQTFARTATITNQLEPLKRLTSDLLIKNGYQAASPETAESLVTLSIQSDVNDATSPDELRLMKGTHGSNFPSPNPRVRDLESDYFAINITNAKQGKLLYSAKCRLLPKQGTAAAPGIVTWESLSQCVHEVVPSM